MHSSFSFTTDTAALSIFDLQAIRHRIDDTSDWWTIEQDELEESNYGRILFLHVEHDGTYDVHIVAHIEQPQMSGMLYIPSGQLFAGAAEDTTGGDLEPDDSSAVSGQLWTIRPGVYQVQATRQQQSIQMALIWLADAPSAIPNSNRPTSADSEIAATSTINPLSSHASPSVNNVILNNWNQRLRL
ncbi:DUF6386 family protein [Paenibacillus sp. WLX2291]|uniref:DUF6386 family protein n=1 Tax=Paenibacillus sp. WLX2291 TaxID=3296934 RepID=UPI0039841FB8